MTAGYVVPSPDCMPRLVAGVKVVGRLLAPTLGPCDSGVWHSTSAGQLEIALSTHDLLRRLLRLPDPVASVGAGIAREALMRLEKRVGDGLATTAVMLSELSRQLARGSIAGISPSLLAEGLDFGLDLALDSLKKQSVMLAGEHRIFSFAQALTGDSQLGAVLAEVFDLMGADAAVMVRAYEGDCLDTEYVHGGIWWARPVSREYLPPGQDRLTLRQPWVCVSLDPVTDAQELATLLREYSSYLERSGEGASPLLLASPDFGSSALELLLANYERNALPLFGVVFLSGGSRQLEDLEDLAYMSGSTPLGLKVSRGLKSTREQDWGRLALAEINWGELVAHADRNSEGFAAERARQLMAYANSGKVEHEAAERLRERAGRIGRGLAIIRVASKMEAHREEMHRKLERGVRAMRSALVHGVVPGAGVAYLRCATELEAFARGASDHGHRLAIKALAAALRAPILQLLANCGCADPSMVARDLQVRPGSGIVWRHGRLSMSAEYEVADSLEVASAVLQTAVSAARALVMTGSVYLEEGHDR